MPPNAPKSPSVPAWVNAIQRHRALIVPIAFISLIVILLVPLPPVIMDIMIAANICVAVVMLLTTMYMEEPLDFSVFPSLLLGTTLLRLVLNVASTRLILTADASGPEEAVGVAGQVISAFGSFVAGGSMFVGVVIFLILVLVQFLVITKGATRISEVAARFTLDAMPGKQMAIDADLNAGIISEQEARDRREKISQESDFFGAMDGASKFVKGDAIAGIIITIVNILGGLAVGAIEKGWNITQTAEVFTKLTIGDGIASQVPSFIIAIAAALIVTRSSNKATLGNEITGQLASQPIALYITAGFLGILAITPLPTLPLLSLALTVGGIAFFFNKSKAVAEHSKQLHAEAEARAEAASSPEAPEVDEMLKVDTLELEIGVGLIQLVNPEQGGDLLDRIESIRRQLAGDIGLVMPPVRIRDNMTLDNNTYRIKIRGNTVAEAQVIPDMLLAMDSGITTGSLQGLPTKEPAFNLDATWIDPNTKQRAENLNYTVVDPASVLTTHMAELVKGHADELLTREEVNNLITQLRERAPKLVEEVVPGVLPPGDIQKVLQSLLRERVPIRDMETIIESLGDWARKTKDTDVLVEYTRNALKRTITNLYTTPAEPGTGLPPKLACITIDPQFEDLVNAYIDRSNGSTTLSIPADAANTIARCITQTIEPLVNAGYPPVVITSPQVRAQIHEILSPHLPNAAVLGYNEVIQGVDVESLGLVALPEEATQQPAA